jgi:hypothetical protein
MANEDFYPDDQILEWLLEISLRQEVSVLDFAVITGLGTEAIHVLESLVASGLCCERWWKATNWYSVSPAGRELLPAER